MTNLYMITNGSDTDLAIRKMTKRSYENDLKTKLGESASLEPISTIRSSLDYIP